MNNEINKPTSEEIHQQVEQLIERLEALSREDRSLIKSACGSDCQCSCEATGVHVKDALYPSLTKPEVAHLLLTVSMLISTEVRTLRSEVYQLLLASQK